MLATGLKQLVCGTTPQKSPVELQGSISCSLDSRLPEIELPLPCSGDVILQMGSDWTGQVQICHSCFGKRDTA